MEPRAYLSKAHKVFTRNKVLLVDNTKQEIKRCSTRCHGVTWCHVNILLCILRIHFIYVCYSNISWNNKNKNNK